MKHNLTLVTLTPEQIARAKEINGKRKRITHALLCAPYGQLFGTEKQCLKYYRVWKQIFSNLFVKAVLTDNHDIVNYHSTFNLVHILINASDNIGTSTEILIGTDSRAKDEIERVSHKKRRRGFLKRLFSCHSEE